MNNFLELLFCEMNVFEIFNIIDDSEIFVISRNGEIQMESNF